MNVIKTAKLKITSHTKTLEPTLEIYRKALSFYIDVVQKKCDSIRELGSSGKLLLLETIIHKTRQNPEVKYDFDKDFYKFSGYLRRACIMEGAGYVESYYSNYERWQKEKGEALIKGKKPPCEAGTSRKEQSSTAPLIGISLFQ
jgi:hypothetical protein